MSAVIVLILSAAVDVLWIGWATAARNHRAVVAAAYTAGIQLLAVMATLLVVDHRELLWANVIGHAAGSLVGVLIMKPKETDAGDAKA